MSYKLELQTIIRNKCDFLVNFLFFFMDKKANEEFCITFLNPINIKITFLLYYI